MEFVYIVIDQIIHVLVIIMSYPFIKNIDLFNINGGTVLTKKMIEAFKKDNEYTDNDMKRWKVNSPVANFEIAALLDNEIQQETNKKIKAGAGEIIGNIERLLIFTLIIFNKYSSIIAFVLTAKSIARFKELEKQNFSDIYLIGTLTSYSIAIITGIWLNLIVVHLGIDF